MATRASRTRRHGSRLLGGTPVRLDDLLRDAGPPQPPEPPSGRDDRPSGPRRFGSFRLPSLPGQHAPTLVRELRALWRTGPERVIDELVLRWELHPEPAQALGSGFVPFRLDGDTVVFDYYGGLQPREPVWRPMAQITSTLLQPGMLQHDVLGEALTARLIEQARVVDQAIRDVGTSRQTLAPDGIAARAGRLLDDLQRHVFLVHADALALDPEDLDYVLFFEAESLARALLRARGT